MTINMIPKEGGNLFKGDTTLLYATQSFQARVIQTFGSSLYRPLSAVEGRMARMNLHVSW